ncbi:hypothetical protein SAY87_001396 [Trapa incisa]|uniref:Uncharacterized protein n=1 Tax=Trapa incisa TaxID=236973 RepID=A0AAN7JHL3_9MYRT|nr:hypothetical protein SAY87_001396 [Trapa incisa]
MLTLNFWLCAEQDDGTYWVLNANGDNFFSSVKEKRNFAEEDKSTMKEGRKKLTALNTTGLVTKSKQTHMVFHAFSKLNSSLEKMKSLEMMHPSCSPNQELLNFK